MYYEDYIYNQTNHQGVRNLTNVVNTSSDFCIWNQPQFTMSGTSKVPCNDTICVISAQTFNSMLSAATDTCFTQQNLSATCLDTIHWKTKISANNDVVYSADFHTSSILTGNLPTDTQFSGSVITALDSLDYSYTNLGSTFTIDKPYGVTGLTIDICVNFDLTDDCLVSGLTSMTAATCDCPSGYIATINLDECELINYTASTTGGTIYTASTGDVLSVYDQNGGVFLPNIMNYTWPLEFTGNTGVVGAYSGTNFMIDATGVPVEAVVGGPGLTYYNQPQVTTDLWDSNGSSAKGRMNNAGINTGAINEWVGYSFCIDGLSGGTYHIGIAADDQFRFKMNGDEVFRQINPIGGLKPPYSTYSLSIQHFYVFEVDLPSGKNIFEGEYYNTGGFGNLTFELYSGTTIGALSAMTTEVELSAVTAFSTGNQIGTEFQTGESSGYMCPSGYTLDTCSGGTNLCIEIVKTPIDCYSGFTGTCAGTCTNICNDTFSAITTGNSSVHIFTTATTQDITFTFTANTSTFIDDETVFKYEIYKYHEDERIFRTPAQYKSDATIWSSFSGTSAFTDTIQLSDLSPDGEYLVKGYYIHNACTDLSNRLGITYDTSDIKVGESFGLYQPASDFYMSIFTEASVPVFASESIITPFGGLKQGFINVIDGQSVYVGPNDMIGNFFVTLNGLVLAKDVDYTVGEFSGGFKTQSITLSSSTISTDILTFVYSISENSENNGLVSEVKDVITIVSGATDGEGTNEIYYNTDTSKYEAFTDSTPSGTVLVTLNGVTLANGIDYYSSITNPKRIIFEGTLLVGDILVVVFNQSASVVGTVDDPTPLISWSIPIPPTLINGVFLLEFATNDDMTGVVSSATTAYIIAQNRYTASGIISGDIGTTLYYRVKNTKNYVTLCGDIIETIAYSEIIPITIATNSINSY